MDKENFVDWQSLIDEAHEKLVGEKAKRIRIPWKIVGDRETSLPTSIVNQGGIYAIWIDGIVRYIGEALKIQSRLRTHIIYASRNPATNTGTESKLSRVLKAKEQKQKIEVSFVVVQPVSLRLLLEEEVIHKVDKDNKDHKERALWNTHAKVQKKK